MGDDLIERLRALSRHEHSDYSIGDEAAAEIEELREQLDWTVKQNDELLNEGRELTARAERLAATLRPFAGATLTPTGQVIGLMREDFENAITALNAAQENDDKVSFWEPLPKTGGPDWTGYDG